MAITKSAKKAFRQSQRRRVGNSVLKNKMKSLVKEAKSLVSQKKTAEAEKLLPQVYEILDKAAKKGLIKKNTASRKKSRIAKAIIKSRQ